MKNTKKVLSVALAGALAFGSMGAAFAASPVMDEKTNSNIKEAVERLYAFGIVNGMEDGKYHEEMKVTREQFAKIIVEAMGLGSAADAAKGSTKFADVEASRWSAGYVNVAVGQGLLKGYPDGTFRPAAEVSYAESVTMLVRALGYKDEFLPGSWPGNYVAKAADVKITDGASFSDANGKADRGTVALLVDNTLDAKVVKVDTYQGGTTKYYESKKTLLKDKLDISKYENARVVADKTIDDGLDKEEVRVQFLKDMDPEQRENAKNDYEEGEVKEINVKENVNVKPAMGEEATVYVDKNDKIVYVESEKDDKANYDYLNEIISGKDGDVSEVNLIKFDKELKFAKDAQLYVFDSKDEKYDSIKVNSSKEADVKIADILGKYGKFVVKNNEIVYARIDDSSELNPWMFVNENKDGILKGHVETNDEESINLGKDTSYDGILVFDTNGNKMEIKDIEKGDIVQAQKQTYDGDDYAIVTVIKKNAVTGKMDKYKADRLALGDKEYKMSFYTEDNTKKYEAFYSVDKDEVKAWNTDKDWENDMDDADDAEMTGYLDPTGRIMFLSSDVEQQSSDMFGIVTRVYRDSDKVKVFTKDADGKGEEITYEAEETSDLDKVHVGSVIKFNLNKKGQIAEDEIKVATKKYKVKGDYGKNSIKTTSGDVFSVDNDATIINAKDFKPEAYDEDSRSIDEDIVDEFGIVKWENISDDNGDGDEFYVFLDDNDVDVDGIVFFGENGIKAASDAEAIYVIDKWHKDGDVWIEYANEDGKVEKKQVNNYYEDESKKDKINNKKVQKEEAYVAKINSSGEVDLYNSVQDSQDNDDYVVHHYVVEKREGDAITFKGIKKSFKLPSDAVVYDEDVKKSVSNIKKGDKVGVIIEDEAIVRVLELNDGCDTEKTEDVVAVKSVELNKEKETLTVDESITLKATINPDKATNKDVEWSSDNEKIATVNKDGKVTAHKEGTATITVTTEDGNKTAKCEITVTKEETEKPEEDKEVTIKDLDNKPGTPVAGKNLVKITLTTDKPEGYTVTVRGEALELREDSKGNKVFIGVVDGDEVSKDEVKIEEK